MQTFKQRKLERQANQLLRRAKKKKIKQKPKPFTPEDHLLELLGY